MKKIIILTILALATSCSPAVNYLQPVEIKANAKINGIQIQGRSFSFRVKAAALRAKSIDAFLSSNPANPFVSGSNPLGDNTGIRVDITASEIILNFRNVPAGGPYYGFVAAFDEPSDSLTRTNITEVNPDLTSAENRWTRTINRVTVTPAFSLVYSDGGNQLKVDLRLEPFNNLDFNVNPVDGNNSTAPIIFN